MVRKIITIDERKCNGCGLCAQACREGAIGIVNGTAKLLRDDYCDGLGNCLPVCPTGAITFEEREAQEYNEQAVAMNMHTAHCTRCIRFSGCRMPRQQCKEYQADGAYCGSAGERRTEHACPMARAD
jgi:MinD superfamily P-loop ATPase